jgi:hypothetical protein
MIEECTVVFGKESIMQIMHHSFTLLDVVCVVSKSTSHHIIRLAVTGLRKTRTNKGYSLCEKLKIRRLSVAAMLHSFKGSEAPHHNCAPCPVHIGFC